MIVTLRDRTVSRQRLFGCFLVFSFSYTYWVLYFEHFLALCLLPLGAFFTAALHFQVYLILVSKPGLRFTKLYYHSFLFYQSFSLERCQFLVNFDPEVQTIEAERVGVVHFPILNETKIFRQFFIGSHGSLRLDPQMNRLRQVTRQVLKFFFKFIHTFKRHILDQHKQSTELN